MRTAKHLSLWLLILPFALAADKPKVAVFPLGGTASADQREKVGFSLRAKLDRDGHYDVIDGPTMAEMAGDQAIGFPTELPALQSLAKDADASVLIWGELDDKTLRLKTFDINQPDPLPHEF